jgi:hypothetical protein
MANGFQFDALVNPRQRARFEERPAKDGFAPGEWAGALAPADLADALESLAAQVRAALAARPPTNVRVHIRTLRMVVIQDPRLLAGPGGTAPNGTGCRSSAETGPRLDRGRSSLVAGWRLTNCGRPAAQRANDEELFGGRSD